MRNLKFISLMMGCLAAVCVTFTSCNDDDDDNRGLTPQEQQTAFSAVRGSYSGSMIYSNIDPINSNKQTTDTVACSLSVETDSTMSIHNFPIAAISKSVSDTAVRKAIENLRPVELHCNIGFIRVTPPTFIINPITPEFQLTYGGKQHKVSIPFYVNTYYSYGQLSNSTMNVQVIAGGIFEDGKQQAWLSSAVPFVFTTKTNTTKK